MRPGLKRLALMRPASMTPGLLRPALMIPEIYVNDTLPVIKLINAKNKQVLINAKISKY